MKTGRIPLPRCPVKEVRINGDRINGLYLILLINVVYWGYNPLILTFLLTSWDIQVHLAAHVDRVIG